MKKWIAALALVALAGGEAAAQTAVRVRGTINAVSAARASGVGTVERGVSTWIVEALPDWLTMRSARRPNSAMSSTVA